MQYTGIGLSEFFALVQQLSDKFFRCEFSVFIMIENRDSPFGIGSYIIMGEQLSEMVSVELLFKICLRFCHRF